MRHFTFAVLALLLIGGCSRPPLGVLDATGYRSVNDEVGVQPMDNGAPAAVSLMPPGWQVDNFYAADSQLEAKTGETYEDSFEIDLDGDGQYEDRFDTQAYYLRFVHRATDSVVWFRPIPLSAVDRDKDLRVLAERVVDNVARNRFESVRFGPASVETEGLSQATQVLVKHSARLGTLSAYALRFDIANVNQLKLDSKSRRERVQLLLIRPDFHWTAGNPPRPLPVLLVAGYSSTPADFDRFYADYVGFLQRLRINGKSGVKLPPTLNPKEAQ